VIPNPILFQAYQKRVKLAVFGRPFYNILYFAGIPTSNQRRQSLLKRKVYNMSEDIRKEQDKAPAEHKSREGASTHSGFQPSSKFSNQGSTAEETSVTTSQRGGKNTDPVTPDWQ
jgi:hypothetical protein